MTKTDPTLVIGIDTGGTFTDVTLLDLSTGQLWTAKTPSTPEDPSLAFGDALDLILHKAEAPKTAVSRVLHATTVATNLILEEKGPTTAMLVTSGFKYVPDIGRQSVPRGDNLYDWVKPKRQLRPRNIWEIGGRLDPDGSVVEHLDEEAVRKAATAIRAAGIRSVSIVFLHSYANPEHERRAARVFREIYPEALLTLSADVMPVFREYERSTTSNFNAYVMSAVSSYVGRLQSRMIDKKLSAPLLLMKSSGGVASARAVGERPVETALSGPAAGVVGANFIAESVDASDLICIDIGGTSADISMIRHGLPELTNRGKIGSWPVSLPIVDVNTIGAGGGSIARVSEAGRIAVGPQSAGARPGPVCYRRGGEEPTVTDAHLVLGHLPPFLLDRGFELDVEAARASIRGKIAIPLGISVEAAAQGILDIADSNMIGAIRVVSVERGYDPRDCVLVPFGGAGPLHGSTIARSMGIRTILLPPAPGVLSALGLLISDLKAEFSNTVLQHNAGRDVANLAKTFQSLSARAEEWFELERIAPKFRKMRWLASMRYRNQGHELTVPWPSLVVDSENVEAAIESFHAHHERVYSFAQRDMDVEIADLRIEAKGVLEKPQISTMNGAGKLDDARIGSIQIILPEERVTAPIYARKKLSAGLRVEGPCVITQLDATTFLLPSQIGNVHPNGSILVTDTTLAAS